MKGWFLFTTVLNKVRKERKEMLLTISLKVFLFRVYSSKTYIWDGYVEKLGLKCACSPVTWYKLLGMGCRLCVQHLEGKLVLISKPMLHEHAPDALASDQALLRKILWGHAVPNPPARITSSIGENNVTGTKVWASRESSWEKLCSAAIWMVSLPTGQTRRGMLLCINYILDQHRETKLVCQWWDMASMVWVLTTGTCMTFIMVTFKFILHIKHNS